MKPQEIRVRLTITNLGKIDGTTRDTWQADATAHAAYRKNGTGSGRGKRPEVAANRAMIFALDSIEKHNQF